MHKTGFKKKAIILRKEYKTLSGFKATGKAREWCCESPVAFMGYVEWLEEKLFASEASNE